MQKRTFQLIALAVLPAAIALGIAVGRALAAFFAQVDVGAPMLLSLLAYLLGTLAAVLIWAVVLLPLRSRAGYTPLRSELDDIRRDGLVHSVQRQKVELERDKSSRDPKTRAAYHSTMALTALLLMAGGGLLTWVLWTDGYFFALPIATVLAGVVLGPYHTFRWLAWRGR